jgi:hypothetical protein
VGICLHSDASCLRTRAYQHASIVSYDYHSFFNRMHVALDAYKQGSRGCIVHPDGLFTNVGKMQVLSCEFSCLNNFMEHVFVKEKLLLFCRAKPEVVLISLAHKIFAQNRNDHYLSISPNQAQVQWYIPPRVLTQKWLPIRGLCFIPMRKRRGVHKGTAVNVALQTRQ